MKIALTIALTFLLSITYSQSTEIIKKGKVTIQGTALSAIAGTIILTKNNSTYYISKGTFETHYYPNGEEALVDNPPSIMHIIKRSRRIKIYTE